jgi:tRNA(Ile)-lysidine synthase TilS/MesJ
MALLEKHEVFRPGFTRLSFPYWSTKEEIDSIIASILFVATHGWKFLSSYRYNHKTGEWAHSTRLTRFPERLWISSFNLLSPDAAAISVSPTKSKLVDDAATSLETFSQVMKRAYEEVTVIEKSLSKKKGFQGSKSSSENISDLESIKWFVLAEEIHEYPGDEASETIGAISGPIQPLQHSSGGVMKVYLRSRGALEVSSYVEKRSVKLRSRKGGENVEMPRYIDLGSTDALQLHVSTNVITATRQAMIESTDMIMDEEERRPNIADIEEKMETVNQTITTSAEPEESTCVNGSCLMPRKQSAVSKDQVIANSSVAILQGPGYTYLGSPKPTITPCKIPKKIMKVVGQAVKDWKMIEEGDRLLLGLSGGKDSLCLLHVLLALQKRAPVRFEIACATVDPQTESYDPSPLIPYIQSLGVTYHYLSEPIVELAKSKLQGDSLCAFCSRFKRGLLYSCCRNFRYNKLVLGQHLDDLAESFLMSALHNGQVRTMKANYAIQAGDIRVIRPLVYLRETQTRDFSVSSKLPIINENCPACFEQPKERARVKKLLLQEESMVQNLYFNLKKGLQPLMHERVYEVMAEISKEIEVNNKVFIHRSPSTAVIDEASAVAAGEDPAIEMSMHIDNENEIAGKRPRYQNVDEEDGF